jgi:hypothetical protein
VDDDLAWLLGKTANFDIPQLPDDTLGEMAEAWKSQKQHAQK